VKAYDITISDVIGKKIFKSDGIQDNLVQINVTSWPEGIYFLTLRFRTPYSAQCELAIISKIIFKLVPGKVVSVWFNKLANSAAA